VTRYKFRALVTLDVPAQGLSPERHPGKQHVVPDTGEPHPCVVHAWHLGHPYTDKYFQAFISQDDGLPLQPGKGSIVTITVNDDHALEYLDAGQQFSIWGGSAGHGIISRRVFSDGSPS